MTWVGEATQNYKVLKLKYRSRAPNDFLRVELRHAVNVKYTLGFEYK